MHSSYEGYIGFFRNFFSNCFVFLFSLYLFSCVFLISGKLFGFPVRVILSVLVLAACFAHVLVSDKIRARWLFCVVFIFLLLSVWAGIGLLNGYPEYSVWGQLLDVFSTVFPLIFGAYAHYAVRYDIVFAFRVIIFGCFLHALFKIIYFVLMYSGVWAYGDFVEWCLFLYGLVPITLIAGDFVRINNVNDFFFPLVLVCLFLPVWGRGRWLLFAVIVIALIISYSRYLWFYSFVVCFLAALIFFRGKYYFYFGLAFFALALIVPFYVDYSGVYQFVLERYSGEKAGVSDSIREEMFPYLVDMINQSPLLGNGFGSYAREYYRFEANPWLYELQWLSWIKDVGFVGLLLTLFGLFKYYQIGFYSFLRINKYFILWGTCLILWLASGLVNCFLLGAAAGVLYYLLWLMRAIDLKGGF